MHKQDIEQLLIEAVDEALSSFGSSSKEAIFYHLDESFNVKKEEIPSKTQPFMDALEKIFGPGTTFIEALIIKRLDDKLKAGLKSQIPKPVKLSEYVTMAKDLSEKEDLEVYVPKCDRKIIES